MVLCLCIAVFRFIMSEFCFVTLGILHILWRGSPSTETLFLALCKCLKQRFIVYNYSPFGQ